MIKDEEWSMKAVASAVQQFLATHNSCVVLCDSYQVTDNGDQDGGVELGCGGQCSGMNGKR